MAGIDRTEISDAGKGKAMAEKKVVRVVRGESTVDGAGVRLVRVLGRETVEDFDPFLMLDSFDSTNPDDYVRGFPMHPHRGIETITYLVRGEIVHKDSLGNGGVITDGGTQWMTAGSGILHEEMPQPSGRMLGLQLWLNLPAREKMTEPKYFDIRREDTLEIVREDYRLRLISGEWEGAAGRTPHHLQATVIELQLREGKTLAIPTSPEQNSFLFLLEGDALVAGARYGEKSALLLGEGDTITLSAAERPLRFMFLEGPRLREPVAWGGPIVMNTKQELEQAFADLRTGNFIR